MNEILILILILNSLFTIALFLSIKNKGLSNFHKFIEG